jgi:hypothetical protein
VKRATSGEPTGGPGAALRGGSRGDASARSSYDFAHWVEDRQAVGHTWVTPHSGIMGCGQVDGKRPAR